jgi:hypothetical protein
MSHDQRQQIETDRDEDVPPRVELGVRDTVRGQPPADDRTRLKIHEPEHDRDAVGAHPDAIEPPHGGLAGPAVKGVDAQEREQLHRAEADLEEVELQRAPRERRKTRHERAVSDEKRREPGAEAPLRPILEQDVHHDEGRVEHRQLVEHLQLESQRGVKRDAAHADDRHHQERKQEARLERAPVQPEAEQPHGDHRQARNAVGELAHIRVCS